MISAPISSSASLRRPFTVACVPTGIKNGVCTAPCGVLKTPRRAPVGSVFVTSNERLTSSVYQGVSGEDKRPSHAANDERRPQAEHNHVRFAPLELFGACGSESDSQKDHGPYRENVNRFAERHQPLRRFVR